MVFDLNNWYDKAIEATDETVKDEYMHFWRTANKELNEEFQHFLQKINNQNYTCHINEQYLDQTYTTLLKGDVYVPSELLLHIIKKYKLPDGTYSRLTEFYTEKGWIRSLHG